VEEEAISQLALKINDMLAQPMGLPEALKLFPQEGKEDLSDAYIAQNFLGYSFMHSAFTTKYKTEGGFQLFIIKDSPEALQKMLDDYTKMLKDEKPAIKGDLIIAKDPYNGAIFMQKKGEYLVGVMNTDKEALAAGYIQRVIQQIQ
jgi:hypothetical protein